ncbi:hypothetical protein [Streptomyces sp. 1222.5]|uniref:hypothetical protein n=1 Tax=Streptomyces sp. 1222.5 TaxID=1881026 RepID=UPI003D7555C7
MLETLLAAALRTGHLDPKDEQRALTAFRAAAHSASARRARTRRRDDWRPSEEQRVRHPGRIPFGVVFASLTLGGVAVAAIGSTGSHQDGAPSGPESSHPSVVAPDQPGGTATATSPGNPGTTTRPSPAQDTEAHCRAYQEIGKHGHALDSTAWQQPVVAAGGKNEVAAYCSAQLPHTTAPSTGASSRGKPGQRAAEPAAGNTDAPGSATSGNRGSASHPGDTRTTAETGQADGGSGQTGGGKGSDQH